MSAVVVAAAGLLALVVGYAVARAVDAPDQGPVEPIELDGPPLGWLLPPDPRNGPTPTVGPPPVGPAPTVPATPPPAPQPAPPSRAGAVGVGVAGRGAHPGDRSTIRRLTDRDERARR